MPHEGAEGELPFAARNSASFAFLEQVVPYGCGSPSRSSSRRASAEHEPANPASGRFVLDSVSKVGVGVKAAAEGSYKTAVDGVKSAVGAVNNIALPALDIYRLPSALWEGEVTGKGEANDTTNSEQVEEELSEMKTTPRRASSFPASGKAKARAKAMLRAEGEALESPRMRKVELLERKLLLEE